jgi:RNA recognition motif-containing protein
MFSERLENNNADLDPINATQLEIRQSHNSSLSHSLPTMPQDPQTSPSTQQIVGQSYEQQNISQNTQDPTGITTLAVTNLPYRIRWQDLKDLFRRYGTPSRADVFLAPDGRSRGVGMVSMRTRREAENCVNDLNGYEWFGRKIGVQIDETGGHHALAAAAMAGATIWEGVSFSQTDCEVYYPVILWMVFFCFITCVNFMPTSYDAPPLLLVL